MKALCRITPCSWESLVFGTFVVQTGRSCAGSSRAPAKLVGRAVWGLGHPFGPCRSHLLSLPEWEAKPAWRALNNSGRHFFKQGSYSFANMQSACFWLPLPHLHTQNCMPFALHCVCSHLWKTALQWLLCHPSSSRLCVVTTMSYRLTIPICMCWDEKSNQSGLQVSEHRLPPCEASRGPAAALTPGWAPIKHWASAGVGHWTEWPESRQPWSNNLSKATWSRTLKSLFFPSPLPDTAPYLQLLQATSHASSWDMNYHLVQGNK